MKYRTIVADPPWHYKGSLPRWKGAAESGPRSEVPYSTMSIPEICALPVAELAEADAHLYLWTTNTHLEHAWSILKAWGFRYSTLLTWCKPPRGFAGFPTYNCTAEYVVFGRRGSLKADTRIDTSWFQWPRGPHSAKPEAFLDMVEQVSPGPYLEMFARRNRLGWDTWGNECLRHVGMAR